MSSAFSFTHVESTLWMLDETEAPVSETAAGMRGFRAGMSDCSYAGVPDVSARSPRESISTLMACSSTGAADRP